MGLLQKACETYDCHARYAGSQREGNETLAPVSHIITSAQIEITLDQDGNFVEARAVARRRAGSSGPRRLPEGSKPV